MADFLKRLKSLAEGPNSSARPHTISISSRTPPSSQTTQIDEQTGTPIIAPLDTLEQVLSWEAGCDDLCVATVPLRCQNGECPMADPSAQKMIVCHDMMGGYVKDKFIQGVRDLEDYFFYHWQHIEAFIYFSHHFITIPPPSWTNAAHRHGVLSMGTLITEWKDGAKICHSLLQDEFKVMQFAQQLVGIAQYYRFDGWLVNIENPIHPKLLDQLYMFLSLLSTGMHGSCPGSKVIWYDSVTTEGKLKWQNMLNYLNRPYFDLCDGIFLNYNWTELGLSSSMALAKERKGEIYVGIDAFGRGCPGGGGFNSSEALKTIHKCGLSSALFAPGWVFETHKKQEFFSHQNRFWSLLQPWLRVTPISSLPLVSSFGRGCGTILAIDGEIVFSGAWTNHSAQDLQPSFCTESAIQNDQQSAVVLEHAGLDLTTAYNNGASLKVRGKIRETKIGMNKPSLLRLFKTDLRFSRPLVVAYTRKVGPAQGYRYFIQLHTSGSHKTRIFLDPFSKEESSESLLSECGLPRSCDVSHLPGCVLAPLAPPHSTTLHQIYTGRSEQDTAWKTCYFVVDFEMLRGVRLQEITLGFYSTVGGQPTSSSAPQRQFSLNIGQIKVIDSHSLSPKSELSIISNIWSHDFHFSSDHQTVSFSLSWQALSSSSDPIDHCNIFLSTVVSESLQDAAVRPWKSEHVFLGRSYTTSYLVTDLYLLSVSGNEGSRVAFEFYVQAVTASGCKLVTDECKLLVVNFEK